MHHLPRYPDSRSVLGSDRSWFGFCLPLNGVFQTDSMVLGSSFCAFLARFLKGALLWTWRGSMWPTLELDGNQSTLNLALTVQRNEAAQGSPPPGAKLGLVRRPSHFPSPLYFPCCSVPFPSTMRASRGHPALLLLLGLPDSTEQRPANRWVLSFLIDKVEGGCERGGPEHLECGSSHDSLEGQDWSLQCLPEEGRSRQCPAKGQQGLSNQGFSGLGISLWP